MAKLKATSSTKKQNQDRPSMVGLVKNLLEGMKLSAQAVIKENQNMPMDRAMVVGSGVRGLLVIPSNPKPEDLRIAYHNKRSREAGRVLGIIAEIQKHRVNEQSARLIDLCLDAAAACASFGFVRHEIALATQISQTRKGRESKSDEALQTHAIHKQRLAAKMKDGLTKTDALSLIEEESRAAIATAREAGDEEAAKKEAGFSASAFHRREKKALSLCSE
jgi:hypothetical protein